MIDKKDQGVRKGSSGMEFKDFASRISLLNDIEKFEEENIEKF